MGDEKKITQATAKSVNDWVGAYYGDDAIDMPVMKRVGIAVAVADGIPELDEFAHYRTTALGGHGAVCEIMRKLIIGQGNLDKVMERYRR